MANKKENAALLADIEAVFTELSEAEAAALTGGRKSRIRSRLRGRVRGSQGAPPAPPWGWGGYSGYGGWGGWGGNTPLV